MRDGWDCVAGAAFGLGLLVVVGLFALGVKCLLSRFDREAWALYISGPRCAGWVSAKWRFRVLAVPCYLLAAAALFYLALALLWPIGTPMPGER